MELTPGELEIILQLRRLKEWGFGNISIDVVAGKESLIKRTESTKVISAVAIDCAPKI